MELKFPIVKHFNGEQAYLIRWIMTYDCQVRISSIKALEKNLEVLVAEDGEVVGWRYDHPENMKDMLLGEGEWESSWDFISS